jgi:intein-encoded DNA endonuclease-like protein
MGMVPYQRLLKDAEMNGSLTRKLKLWRKNGMSYRDIAEKLSQSGISVSRGQVDKWCSDLNLEKGK